jgi:hypothetical protein
MATSTTTIIIIIAVVVLLLAMIGGGATFTFILCRRKDKPAEREDGDGHRERRKLEVQKTQNKILDGKIGGRGRSDLNPNREPAQSRESHGQAQEVITPELSHREMAGAMGNRAHGQGTGLKEAGVGISQTPRATIRGAPESEAHNQLTSVRDTAMWEIPFATQRNGAYGQRWGHAPVAKTVGGYPPEMMHRRQNDEVGDPNSLNSTIPMRPAPLEEPGLMRSIVGDQGQARKSVTHAPKHAERCWNTLPGGRNVHVQTRTCSRNDMRDEIIPTSRIKTHQSSHQRQFQRMPAQLTMCNNSTASTPWARNGKELTVAVGVGRKDIEMMSNEAYIKTERQCEEEEDHYYY